MPTDDTHFIGWGAGIRMARTTRDALAQARFREISIPYEEDEITMNSIRVLGNGYWGGQYNFAAWINMGMSNVKFAVPDEIRLWNDGRVINMTRRPEDLRKTMGDLLPPTPRIQMEQTVWIKPPGRAGRNKVKLTSDGTQIQLPRGWDIQLHLDGPEYRIVTVGNRCVQQHARTGPNGARDYTWLRMDAVPADVKELAREGSRRLPYHNVLAWDIILDEETERPYILEANSAPGVNRDTASRIRREILRQIGEVNA